MLVSRDQLRRFDWVLFGACALLTLFGLAALYSTSLGSDGGVGDFGNFRKQAAFAAVGIAAVFTMAALNYRALAPLAKPLYGLGVAALLAVLAFGQTVRGTKGWFGFGGFGVQPVELVKIVMIVYLAKFFADYARHHSGLRQIFGSGIALAGVVLLVILQPDFGSAFLLLTVWGAILLVSGIRRSHFIVMVLVAVAVAIASWMFVLKPYQKDRVLAFMDPASDPLGKGYNVTQSIIAIGSGGFAGKGLGYGSQSQLRFLPERQNDFIFAVVAEELGFLGVLAICGLVLVIFWRGYRLVSEARDDFTLFLVLGIMVAIGVEAFVNIGGNLRLLPVTGVTLPFVSYGGSSLVAKFAMVGILESIAVRRT